MMLVKFSVSNFKNFTDKLVFDLSSPGNYEFNGEAIHNGCISKGLIYGINASGKSNLCLALSDITLHLTDNQKISPDKYDPIINLYSGNPNAAFEYEFIFDGRKIVYRYEKNISMYLAKEELSIDGNEVLSYDFLEKKGWTSLKGTENLKLETKSPDVSRVKYLKSADILDRDDDDNKVFYAFTDFVDRMLLFYSLRTNEYQGLRLGKENITEEIVSKRKTAEFEKFLNDNKIECTLVEKPIGGHREIYCYFKETDTEVEFWKLASIGTQALALFYYWFYIQDKKPSFIVIDEFDAFYHFELAEMIVETVKKLTDTQIFMTTHNTDLLNNDLLRPDCYFLLSDGKIRALNTLTEKEIRFGNNLQKMYKAGFFE